MNEMTLSGLKRAFDSLWAMESNFFGVTVQLPNGKREFIINHIRNFESKLEYYSNAYNEDLTLKANPSIKIVNYTFGKSFSDIQFDLFM